MKYVVLGGRQGKEDANKSEWHRFDEAVIGELDMHTGNFEIVKSYKSHPAYSPANDPGHVFKSGFVKGSKLYCCTLTEVVVFDLTNYKKLHSISLHSFNDLHHVIAPSTGGILVVSTGLDLVQHVDLEGNVLEEWDVLNPLSAQTWAKFDKGKDYRKVPSTKPHASHPNHVWEFNDQYYVTRFIQRDVVCLQTGETFDIGVEGPHDGIIKDGIGQYTTVDGHLVFIDYNLNGNKSVVDLNTLTLKRRKMLGWCRSLYEVEHGKFLVGFSRLRSTKIKENLKWIQYTLQNKELIPSQLTLVDINKGVILKKYNLEDHGMNVIFSVLPIENSI